MNLVTGDTYVGQLSIGSSGNSGNPVTITVSGGGTANINANGGTGINFGGHSYVTVNGVIGSPAFGGSTTMGISVTNIGASNNCVYENSGGTHDKVLHIECYGTPPGSSQPDDNRGGFFLSNSQYWEVGYNYIHGPVYAAFSHSKWGATCVSMWAATGTTNFNDNLQHDNRCDQMYNDGLRCSANCSIYHNEVSHIDGSGHSDSLLIQSGSYSALYDNYVHDSYDQNTYLDNLYDSACHHIRVYNNIYNSSGGFGGINMDPEGGAGPVAGGSPSGCTGSSAAWDDVVVANNTFYQSSGYNTYWSGRGSITNLVTLNNIFGQANMGGGGWYNVNTGVGTSYASGDSWDYDAYSTASSNYPDIAHTSANYTLAGLKGLIPARETNGKTCNPTYVGGALPLGVQLASSDTCAKGAGANLYSIYAFLQTDLAGNARPSSGSWDLGAYQDATAAGTQPNPPTNLGATVQ